MRRREPALVQRGGAICTDGFDLAPLAPVPANEPPPSPTELRLAVPGLGRPPWDRQRESRLLRLQHLVQDDPAPDPSTSVPTHQVSLRILLLILHGVAKMTHSIMQS